MQCDRSIMITFVIMDLYLKQKSIMANEMFAAAIRRMQKYAHCDPVFVRVCYLRNGVGSHKYLHVVWTHDITHLPRKHWIPYYAVEWFTLLCRYRYSWVQISAQRPTTPITFRAFPQLLQENVEIVNFAFGYDWCFPHYYFQLIIHYLIAL
jgi:hypothetical protein